MHRGLDQHNHPWREGWWEKAFVRLANTSERKGHPKGDSRMVTVIAYDIADPKRLKKVADCCKDFGVRVQFSVFECRLEADRFAAFWQCLCELADPSEDRLVAYPLHAQAAQNIRTYGKMVVSDAVVSYIF
jgi:CRISPR-associated protein Cas2